MLYLIIFNFFFCASFVVLIFKPKTISNNFFKYVNLNNTIQQNIIKNRKNNKINNKNANILNKKCIKLQKKISANKITYKPIAYYNFNFNFYKLKRLINKSKSFCNKTLKNGTNILKNATSILKRFQIKYLFIKYRANYKITLIENVALNIISRCFCFKNFNVIAFYNNIKKVQNLYKKEEKVAYFLLFRAFYAKVMVLTKELISAENLVLKYSKIKEVGAISPNGTNYFLKVYGLALNKKLFKMPKQKLGVRRVVLCSKSAVSYFEQINSDLALSLRWMQFLMNKKFVF